MQRLVVAFFLLSCVLFTNTTAQAQSGIQFFNPQVEYQFGTQVLFKVQIQSDLPLNEVYLFFQSQGESTQTKKQLPASDGALSYSLDLKEGLLRPFAQVTYWFTASAEDGTTATSQQYSFRYEDNRFTWQELSTEAFHIHWIEGDLAFGQAIENAAELGLVSIKKLIPIDVSNNPMDIYVYPHAADLQESLELGGEKWVGGHASPDLNVILVSIPTGQDQEILMEQQIPHEMAHVLLYQKMGPTYANLPVWFSEGFATLAELYPNSDYAQALDKGIQNLTLLPMSSLCQTFPLDTADVYLAYAQSESFVHFLQQNYGSSGLDSLVQNYKNGLGCSDAIQTSFNKSLDDLEKQWKQQSLGIDLEAVAWSNLLPYLVILVLLLLFTIVPGLFLLKRRNHNQSKNH